jgi:hypothetical protein
MLNVVSLFYVFFVDGFFCKLCVWSQSLFVDSHILGTLQDAQPALDDGRLCGVDVAHSAEAEEDLFRPE